MFLFLVNLVRALFLVVKMEGERSERCGRAGSCWSYRRADRDLVFFLVVTFLSLFEERGGLKVEEARAKGNMRRELRGICFFTFFCFLLMSVGTMFYFYEYMLFGCGGSCLTLYIFNWDDRFAAQSYRVPSSCTFGMIERFAVSLQVPTYLLQADSG